VQVWSAGAEYRVQSAGASLGKCRSAGSLESTESGDPGNTELQVQMHRVWSAKPHRYRMQNASTEVTNYRMKNTEYKCKLQSYKNARMQVQELQSERSQVQ
jgi:hypothetical protein